MSVRRLDPVQPEVFAFTAQNEAWAKKMIAQYPEGKQASAVIPLLWRAQEQNAGWVSRAAIEYVASMLGMAFIRVYEVATFYTMFQLSPVGRKAHIQVCGTTPCMLRGAEDLKKVCQRRIHHEPHHVSADGDLSWEEVECLGACVNAPMVQIWKDTYEDLTPESLERLIDDLSSGKAVTPAPQIDRQFSAPEGGLTSLTDKSLYSGNRIFQRTEPPPPPPPAQPTPAVAPAAPPPPAAPVSAAPPPAAPVVAAPPPAAPPAPVAPAAPAKAAVEAAPLPAAALQVAKKVAAKKTPAARKEDGSPELLAKARGGKPDDLKLIWGAGPKLEKMLNTMGVWHFDQIAAWSRAELTWVDDRLQGFKGRAQRDEWIKQAKKLAKGWRPDSAVGEKPK